MDISQRALLNNRSAIDTVAKNIANVNTDGYKRRRVDVAQLIGFGQVTSYTNRENMTRIRNRFIESQLRNEQHKLGKFQTSEMLLRNVESIFGEPLQSGLNSVMSEFWNAWNDLGNNPENPSARVIVRDKSVLLGNTFNRLYNDLKGLQQEVGVDISEKVKRVNDLLRQINSINGQLRKNSSSDLLDQRDSFVSELATILNIEIREYSDNDMTISTGGRILISKDYLGEILMEGSYENGFANYIFRLNSGQEPLVISSGELGSLIAVNNTNIPGFVQKLNQMAFNIAQYVNQIHRNGYNQNGVTNVNFFKDGITGAGDFAVSEEVRTNPDLIATSNVLGEPGNGTLAHMIFDLQTEPLFNNDTITNFYHALISQVGSQVQEASFLRESQEMILQNLKNQQDSVSGVSLDEEMTHLIEYEKAFQAAARLVNTADKMIDTLLSIV